MRNRRLAIIGTLLIVAACMLGGMAPIRAAHAGDPPQFRLGFKALADQVPSAAGVPLEEEHWGENGDSLQQTSKGLMVWRKADNWTAFTNGSKTWVNGPFGVMERGNNERFDWEAPAVVAAPMLVDQTPSDYALAKTETVLAVPDGSRLFRCALANTNHYWTAGNISVSVVLRDSQGRAVYEGLATAQSSSLGPRQTDHWEHAIPGDLAWQSASAIVSFGWIPPGGR